MMEQAFTIYPPFARNYTAQWEDTPEKPEFDAVKALLASGRFKEECVKHPAQDRSLISFRWLDVSESEKTESLMQGPVQDRPGMTQSLTFVDLSR